MITPLAPDPEVKAQFNDIVALLDWLESGRPSDSMTTPASIPSRGMWPGKRWPVCQPRGCIGMGNQRRPWPGVWMELWPTARWWWWGAGLHVT